MYTASGFSLIIWAEKGMLYCSQVMMDLSCGSGLFTRRFVGSKKFKGVIAADYSESMLQHTTELFNKDQLLDHRSASSETTGCLMHADAFSAREMSVGTKPLASSMGFSNSTHAILIHACCVIHSIMKPFLRL